MRRHELLLALGLALTASTIAGMLAGSPFAGSLFLAAIVAVVAAIVIAPSKDGAS